MEWVKQNIELLLGLFGVTGGSCILFMITVGVKFINLKIHEARLKEEMNETINKNDTYYKEFLARLETQFLKLEDELFEKLKIQKQEKKEEVEQNITDLEQVLEELKNELK